jgi:D-3-phosphoglycerate dehydrogenase
MYFDDQIKVRCTPTRSNHSDFPDFGRPTMLDGTKRVFYVRYVADKTFFDVFEKHPGIRIDKLENDSADDTAAPVLAGAHAYQIGSARDELAVKFHADRDLLRRTQSLLIISTNGAGYDTVNVKACTDAGVAVVNQSGGNREAVAEHVLGLMLSLSKRIGMTDRALRKGGVTDRLVYMGNELLNRTVGVIGLGNVGRRVAELCRGLFQMTVLSYDPFLSAEEMALRGAEKVELDELLRRADYVSINCPLTDESRGMIGARQYALMQPHAFLINTARGFIHDEAALLDALKSKTIAGAGLDVWAKEPPPPDHPLLQLDNVVASPHTAGATREARTTMGRIAAEQLVGALDGQRPPRLINPEVWPVYRQRFEQTFGFFPED